MIASDAKEFWDRLAMREKINSSVAGFEHKYENVLRAWNFETVQNEIIPYPKRKELDEMVLGQLWKMKPPQTQREPFVARMSPPRNQWMLKSLSRRCMKQRPSLHRCSSTAV